MKAALSRLLLAGYPIPAGFPNARLPVAPFIEVVKNTGIAVLSVSARRQRGVVAEWSAHLAADRKVVSSILAFAANFTSFLSTRPRH